MNRGAVRPVIDVRDAELVITTGSAENPAGDQTGGTQLRLGDERFADRRLGQQQNVIGHVKDPFASRLEVLIGRRRPIGTKLERLHAQVGTDLRSHGSDVEQTFGAQRCHDPFENHARVSFFFVEADDGVRAHGFGVSWLAGLAVRLLSCAGPAACQMALLGLGQEAPLQSLILTISLAERQGGFGLHQLVAEVERMRRDR